MDDECRCCVPTTETNKKKVLKKVLEIKDYKTKSPINESIKKGEKGKKYSFLKLYIPLSITAMGKKKLCQVEQKKKLGLSSSSLSMSLHYLYWRTGKLVTNPTIQSADLGNDSNG